MAGGEGRRMGGKRSSGGGGSVLVVPSRGGEGRGE